MSIEAPDVANIIAAITALATIGTIAVAVYVLRKQQRQAKDLHEVALILRLEERFESTALRRARARAAAFLLKAGEFEPSRAEAWTAVSDVVDFFQTIGLFQRYGHVRPELTHSWFSFWWENYYQLCHRYILFEQRRNPGSWDDAVDLYKAFISINKAKSWSTELTPESLIFFLHQEVAANEGGALIGSDA